MTSVVKSVLLFVAAGLCEIGGGCLVWLWLRAGRSALLGVLGGLMLLGYGYFPTLQPAGVDFGRLYAAYGGVFVLLSLLWGWQIDRHRPDTPTLVGATVCVVGAAIIMYWPRTR
ncbi:MAG TPA: YnfA family protein [Candidatus Elarobacter sp.]|nr:YnfA family protein [Candidatus Elarobacter sp.]